MTQITAHDMETLLEKLDTATPNEYLVYGMAGINSAETPVGTGEISTEQLEGLYTLALQHYTAQQYAEAETLFQMLCLYKNDDARFWMGLGGCRQALGSLIAAAEAYAMAACAERFASPQPLLFMALSLLHADLREEATTVLQKLAQLGDPADPAHAQCHDRACHLLNMLHNSDKAGK